MNFNKAIMGFCLLPWLVLSCKILPLEWTKADLSDANLSTSNADGDFTSQTRRQLGAIPPQFAGFADEKAYPQCVDNPPPTISLDLMQSTISPPKAAIKLYPSVAETLMSGESLPSRVVEVATQIAKIYHVPYVWGGNNLGNPASCASCEQCIIKKRVGPERRIQRCPACRQCGVDCSHLIHEIFASARLPVPYGTTKEWNRIDRNSLLQHYQLIDLGQDAGAAKPGDLLLYPRHVVMLLEKSGDEVGTVIHATRRARGTGGIKVDRDVKLQNFRGSLRRILRHQDLIDTAPGVPMDKPLVM